MSFAAKNSNGTAKIRSMGILDFSQRKEKMSSTPQIYLTDLDYEMPLSRLHRENSDMCGKSTVMSKRCPVCKSVPSSVRKVHPSPPSPQYFRPHHI